MDKTFDAFKSHRSVLNVLPTGSGKTIIFSHAAKRMEAKTLILAHREELIDQAVQKLHSATGIFAQKEKAEHRASRHAQVVVGSIQTMQGQRLFNWPQDHFGLVVADEAHHSVSESWTRVISHFHTAKVLGVTATPHRGDKKNLGGVFETIGYEIGLFDLIRQGYLSPIVLKSVPLKINVSGVGMKSGDYDVNGLGDALDPYLPLIARSIREHAGFRRILIFCPLIATSEKMNAAMRAEGFVSEHVCGVSPDRKAILARFQSGETEVLCNAMLLTEGYDNPAVDCIVNLRLTKSNALYSQIVGRGTRIFPGKQNMLLFDFLWQHGRHKLCSPAHLIAETEEEAEEMTELSQSPKYGQEQLSLEDLMSETQAQREKALAKALELNRKKKERQERLMESAKKVAELQQGENGPDGPASEKQMRLIVRFGMDPTGLTKTEASKIIGEKFSQQRRRAA